jgi:hypothetical protein
LAGALRGAAKLGALTHALIAAMAASTRQHGNRHFKPMVMGP